MAQSIGRLLMTTAAVVGSLVLLAAALLSLKGASGWPAFVGFAGALFLLLATSKAVLPSGKLPPPSFPPFAMGANALGVLVLLAVGLIRKLQADPQTALYVSVLAVVPVLNILAIRRASIGQRS